MDFSKVKVGTTLYSLRHGYVKVRRHRSQKEGFQYPLVCDVNCSMDTDTWTYDGHIFKDSVTQDLYWTKPTITGGDTPKQNQISADIMHVGECLTNHADKLSELESRIKVLENIHCV